MVANAIGTLARLPMDDRATG